MLMSVLKSSYSPLMTLSCLTTPQFTFSGTGTSFGTRNTWIFYHLTDGCNSLRRRMPLPKRRAEFTEGTPRKKRRPLPVVNAAAGGRAPVGGVGLNGFIFQAPGHVGRAQSTESSSSSPSSEASSDTSSNDASSSSESTSESTSGSSSDSDSDSSSDSTSSSSSDNLVRRVPRSPPSVERQRKLSQPRYVTSMLSITNLLASFVLQA